MTFNLRILILIIAAVLFAPAIVQAEETLTWTDCLKEAAQNNPDLIAAQESIIQQQSAKTISASSFWPQINLGASASSSHSSITGSGKGFDYGASLNQLVFNGFKIVNNVKSAKEDIKAAEQNFKFVSSDVRFNLREAFINLLKAQELIKLTQDIQQIRKNNLDLIQLRYQSGTEHKGALLQAQANLSKSSFEIDQARRNLDTARLRLITAMGGHDMRPVAVQENFDVQNAALEKPDFDQLVKNNPQFLRITAQKNSALFNIKANEADYWPEISLTAQADKSADQWPPNELGTFAGVQVSIPLFEGGARSGRIAQSKSIYRQLEAQEQGALNEITLSLEQNWNGLQDAVENVKVEKEFLTASEERAKISEQQYAVGLIDFDNWTIIEDGLITDKKSFLDAQINGLLAEASWIQAKGGTLEYEN